MLCVPKGVTEFQAIEGWQLLFNWVVQRPGEPRVGSVATCRNYPGT